MSVNSFRVTWVAGAAVAAALLAASCTDDTGPEAPVYGSFGVAPVFAPAAGIVPVTAGRFVLRRTADGVTVVDTVIAIAAGTDSVDLTLTVLLAQPGETFELTIALVGPPVGDTVFRAGPLTVTPVVGTDTPPVIPVPVVYTGVGADAASVVIQVPPAPPLFFGQQLTLQATVLDSAGQPIPNAPVEWRSLDSTRVRVARPDSGRVIAQPLRGPALIVARLLTDQADTVQLLSQPTPSSLVINAGNNQSAPPGGALAQPLVAQVLAADALGVEGIWVRFAVTAGGGTVVPDSVLTSAQGLAAVDFTLGTTGPQTVEATTALLPADTALFTAAVAATGAQVAWVNASGGLWSAGANWSSGAPPGPSDTAVITLAGTYTVTLDVSTTVAGLTLGGASGTQSLDASGVPQNLTVTGPGAIGPNGRIDLVNGDIIFWGGSVLTLNGGTLRVGAGRSFLVGFGDATRLSYASGTIGGPGVLFVNQGAQLDLQAPLSLDSLGFELNDARVNDLGGGRLVIQPQSLLLLISQNGSTIEPVVEVQGAISSLGADDFLSDSLIVLPGGTLQANASGVPAELTVAALDNAGTVLMGGDQPATITVAGGGSFTNSGAVTVLPGAGTHVINATLVNQGTLEAAGSLVVNGGATAAHQNGGAISIFAGQALAVTGGTFANLAGNPQVGIPPGSIAGEGSLDVTGTTFDNSGTVAPGFSPGTLTVGGNVTLSASSQVDIELGGTTVGTGYDRLAIGGAATLDGALNVSLFGFVPAAGDQFSVVTYGSAAGAFRTINLPTLPAGLTWQTTPTATALLLDVAGPPPQIVFAGDSAVGLSRGVFRVNPDATGQTNLTTEGPPAPDIHPRWSPDRTRIAYTANPGGEPNQLHVISFDGLELAHLTSSFDTSTRRARWSPDGAHLAFECGDGGFETSFTSQDVCVIPDVTGPILTLEGIGDDVKSGKTYVTDKISPDLGGSGAFAWDPDRPDELVVVRDSVVESRTGRAASQFWRVTFDGTVLGPVTPNVLVLGSDTLRVVSMDWSPTGAFIAFDAVSQTGLGAIYRLDLTDGKVTQLTFPSFGRHFHPVVSPDGAAIIFGRTNDIWDLAQVPSSGGAVITMSPLMNFGTQQAGWDWSPDGTEIVLTEDITSSSVVISRILPTTTATSFFNDAKPVGRRGISFEVQDQQPNWRP